MSLQEKQAKSLLEKLLELPADRLAEVEDFIDFLRERAHARSMTSDFARRSEEALSEVWDNADDAIYDDL